MKGNTVEIQRSLYVLGKLNLSNTPDFKIGRFGGSFIMYPGSIPNQLDFKNFVINDSPSYRVNLLQNNDTKVVNVIGGIFTMGTGSSFNSASPLTLLANHVTINGVLKAPTLTGAVWNVLSIGLHGSLNTKILSNSFTVNTVTIHGFLSLLNANLSMRVNNMAISGTLSLAGVVKLFDQSGASNVMLTVHKGGMFKILGDSVSSGLNFSEIGARNIDISGQFLTTQITASGGWNQLRVFQGGSMVVQFIDLLRIDNIEISGRLQLLSVVNISGLTKPRTATLNLASGGMITVNSKKDAGLSIIRVSNIKINGTFVGGKISPAEGWDRINVGTQGKLYLELIGELRTDEVTVSGIVEIENSVNIRGLTENRTRNLIINTGGSITLDSKKTAGVSLIRVYDSNINGQFQAETVSPGEGWNSVNIGSKGTMTITFHNALRVNKVIVSGRLIVLNDVRIYGYDHFKTSEFKLEPGSSVKFMARDYNVSCGRKSAYSELEVLKLSIKGSFHAGPLSIHDGINDFSVSNTGNFDFYPVGEFWFNHFNVDGKMTSHRDVVLEGRHNFRIPHAQFGPSSDVVIKRCFNNSRIIATRVTVSGKVVTDLLVIGENWQELTVSGTFQFLPAATFNITKTVIDPNGKWKSVKPFHAIIPLLGNSLTVNQGGLISLNYQQKLEDPKFGSIPSSIKMTNSIAIHGRFEAGSVEMFTNNLTISNQGLITVDWGGYGSGKGPGAGSAASSGSSGASHGGRGGRGAVAFSYKLPYGSIFSKGTWGSGGGHLGSQGGRGGGKVHLEVQQAVRLDGAIQASGEAGMVSFINFF